MESTSSAVLVLVAVALGALLPVAFQLAMALRASRRVIAGAGPRMNTALDELSAAAASANRSMSALDAVALQRAAESLVEIGNLARKARDLTAGIEMATAVGAAAVPAVAAIIK